MKDNKMMLDIISILLKEVGEYYDSWNGKEKEFDTERVLGVIQESVDVDVDEDEDRSHRRELVMFSIWNRENDSGEATRKYHFHAVSTIRVLLKIIKSLVRQVENKAAVIGEDEIRSLSTSISNDESFWKE